MRICALYIVWYDGVEILPFSIDQAIDWADEIIIVYSNASNFGHVFNYQDKIEGLGTLINWEPDQTKQAVVNELAKRNFALDVARSLGYSHFVMMDCDEIYSSFDVRRELTMVKSIDDFIGLVCHTKVYVREPTLMCSDHTRVPFIHKLTPGLKFELNNKNYPFTYDDQGAHIDPTRRLNITSGVKMSQTTMHHFSHVRKDINLKMANSTARSNLTHSTLLRDYENAKPGYYSEFYRQTLQEVPNRFGIRF